MVDVQKIDLKSVEIWLRDYLSKYKCNSSLILDLILDFFLTERYPDAKVLQCELNELKLLEKDKTTKLIKRLWLELTRQNEPEYTHNAKYQKISNSNGSSSRVAATSVTSGYHHVSAKYHYNGSSHQCR